MATDFVLDPQTRGHPACRSRTGPCAQLRLKDDARFHWLLLVPRRAGIGRADRSGRGRLRPAHRRDPARRPGWCRKLPGPTRSTSRPSATSCRRCMCTSLRGSAAIRPGPTRSGATERPDLPAAHPGHPRRPLRQGRQGPLSDAVGRRQESRSPTQVYVLSYLDPLQSDPKLDRLLHTLGFHYRAPHRLPQRGART